MGMVLLPSVWVILRRLGWLLRLGRWLLIVTLLLWRLLVLRLLVLVNDHWPALLLEWGPNYEPDDKANYTGEEYNYDPQCSACPSLFCVFIHPYQDQDVYYEDNCPDQ